MKKLKVFFAFLVIGIISITALSYANIINIAPAKKLVNFGLDIVFNKAKNLTAKSGPSLARYLPEQTTIYLEANNLADLFEQKSRGAVTQPILDATFDLTPEEHRLLSQTHIALALWPNGQNRNFRSIDALDAVIVLETPSEAMTKKIASAFGDLFKNSFALPTNSSSIETKPLDGNNIVVIGRDEVVRNFLATRSSQKPLMELSDFKKLKRANPDHSHFFFYLSATDLKNNPMFSGKDFSFLKNIKALSVNVGTDIKEKPRLSILADTNALVNELFSGEFPVSDFHLADLAPADAAFFFTCKLSAKQFSKDNNTANSNLLSAQFTKEFGSSLTQLDRFIIADSKQQLLDNITGDVALFLSLSNKEDRFSFFPNVTNAVIVETKNINTAKSLIEKSVTGNSLDKKDYKGNTIYYSYNNALTFANQSMIVGDKETVEKTLDSINSKTNLSSEKEFRTVLKEFSNTGLGICYVNVAPVLRRSSGQIKVFLSASLGTFPAQFGFYGGLDGQEIYVEPSFSFSGDSFSNIYYPLLGTASYWWQLSSVITPKPEYSSTYAMQPYLNSHLTPNERSAIETLLLLKSVEATYQDGVGNGQFGTAEQLRSNEFIDSALLESITRRSPKNNYVFTLTVELASADKLSSFQVTATPINPGTERAFFMDDTGVIRYTKEPRVAQQTDLPIKD